MTKLEGDAVYVIALCYALTVLPIYLIVRYHLGRKKPAKGLLIKTLLIIARSAYTQIALFITYISFMLIGPLFVNFSWAYLQDVWERWQSLNVGILAFLSSILVYKATRYNSEQNRLRQFKASKSMLPDALSELIQYMESAAISLDILWQAHQFEAIPSDKDFKVAYSSLPTTPREALKECISLADDDVADHLIRILTILQIFDTRLIDMCEAYSGKDARPPLPDNVFAAMIILAKLHILIRGTFDFARSRSPFTPIPLTQKDYSDSYALLKLDVSESWDKYDTLWEKTLATLDAREGVFSL
ncbi:hypothetical protein [Alteromonas australica]|uniref:hypothetical protein n=1 Tax=Alteromonas australica TaxID=589873 RepID=UPI0023537C1B|nr:hypothetical protein [Alteromonas australica]